MVDIVIGPIQVPNLSSLDEGAATSAVENAYLLIQIQYAYSSTVPAGYVISQSPAPLTEVEPNSLVQITVSLGAAEGAGSSNRRRRRGYVQVDDLYYPVESENRRDLVQQAQDFLERIRKKALEPLPEPEPEPPPPPILVGPGMPGAPVSPFVLPEQDPQALANQFNQPLQNGYAQALTEQRRRAEIEADDDQIFLLF